MIKNYTDLEQSKKLAEILPLESADNYYSWHDERYYIVNKDCPYPYSLKEIIPCWSLAALLSVLPKEIVYDKGLVFLEFHAWNNSLEYINNADYTLCVTKSYDNPIDACYELILKLNELKLL